MFLNIYAVHAIIISRDGLLSYMDFNVNIPFPMSVTINSTE